MDQLVSQEHPEDKNDIGDSEVTPVGGSGEGYDKELFHRALEQVYSGSKVHDCSGAGLQDEED